MPAACELPYWAGNRHPHFFCRAVNHLGGKNWIDLKCGKDSFAAGRYLVRIAMRETFYCKEDWFFPYRQIEDIGLERLVLGWISDRSHNPALHRVRCIPFLKLLMLERIARRIARAR